MMVWLSRMWSGGVTLELEDCWFKAHCLLDWAKDLQTTLF